jgi:hypothetical protein
MGHAVDAHQLSDHPDLADDGDDDDDCDESNGAPPQLTVFIAAPAPSLDLLRIDNIGPARGHRAGPEKPPRA